MNDTLIIILVSILVTAISIPAIFIIVYGASITSIDNSSRREYTYCPLSDSDVKSFNGEVNGCPLARVYVDNWNSLSSIDQQKIDTLLRSKGFVDSGENILK